MIGFDEAAAIVAGLARPVGTERVPLGRAAGRRLAGPVIAALDSPRRAVSSMDGYAVREADIAALPATLRVVREIAAGASDAGAIGPGEAARIFTGAPLPDGADRVVIQEIVTCDGATMRLSRAPGEARFWRAEGSDFRSGELLVAAGTPIGPRQLVAIAGGDVAEVDCARRPRVTIIATGDELVAAGHAAAEPRAVPDSVTPGIAALVEQWGGELVAARRMGDRLDQLGEAAGAAVATSDLVVVSGGASVGAHDHARRMFEGHGLSLHFAGVAMRPGKPVWLGQCGATLVMGLPGNPTSAMVTGRLLLAPLVAGLAGDEPGAAWRWREQQLGDAIGPGGERETFARARLVHGVAMVAGNQDSGAQATLAASDLLLRQPAGAPARRAGERVLAIDF